MIGARASSDVFQAVADPVRRGLLDLLRESELTVLELGRRFNVTQPAISHHLLILKKAGLVSARRVGRQRVYSITPKPLQQMYDWVSQYKTFIDPAGHAWRITREGNRGKQP